MIHFLLNTDGLRCVTGGPRGLQRVPGAFKEVVEDFQGVLEALQRRFRGLMRISDALQGVLGDISRSFKGFSVCVI